MSLKLLETTRLEEIKSDGYLYGHQSGARIVHIKNDDQNKVFSVTFKTPSRDDTGAAHVLEHCVLCGSENFPVKDPFNELSKGSLHTYLNAMTFKDKTMYPVASRNHKDFFNLMNVYLDAVFFPLIKNRREIFMQEGINFKSDEKGNLYDYGGIVYNEMRGVYSDPAEVLYRGIYKSLYRNSQYAFDSGGVPEDITGLTYEGLLNFYNSYYHPSNSYIYLYGDLDFDAAAQMLEKYLSPFKPKATENEILVPDSFNASEVSRHMTLNGACDKKYLAAGYVIGEASKNKLTTAFKILAYYLLGTEASPLKSALIDSGACQEVMDSFNSGIKWPAYIIILKNANIGMDEYLKIFNGTLNKLAAEGLNQQLLTACLNRYEFNLLEENYGMRPRGLTYNIEILTDWIHDGNPFNKLKRLEPLAELKQDPGYFTEIMTEYLLENHRSAFMTLLPGGEDSEAPTSKGDPRQIAAENAALQKYRDSENEKSDLEKIPLLELSDIKPDDEIIPLVERRVAGTKVLHCPLESNGIVYVNFMFDLTGLPVKLLPYVGLLKYLLGKLATEHLSVEALQGELNGRLGGFSAAYNTLLTEDGYIPLLTIKTKALDRNAPDIFALAAEVINKTLFENYAKIYPLLEELLSKLQDSFVNQGHLLALNRVRAYRFEGFRAEGYVEGVEFHDFLESTVAGGKDNGNALLMGLKQTVEAVFSKHRLITAVTSSSRSYDDMEQGLTDFCESLSSRQEFKLSDSVGDFPGLTPNEGLITTSKVQYVSEGFDFIKSGFSFGGKMAVLATALNGNLLMQQVRIKGGAYGCYCGYHREGLFYFYSYRDPNLSETIRVYESCGRFLEDFTADSRQMRRLIIGSINKYLRPKKDFEKSEFAVNAYLRGISQQDIIREQYEILRTTETDIRQFAQMFANKTGFCVTGNGDKILTEANIFSGTRRIHQRDLHNPPNGDIVK